MNEIPHTPIALPIFFGLQIIILIIFLVILKGRISKIRGLNKELNKFEVDYKKLQNSSKKITEEKEELYKHFIFFPDLIEKFTSYAEEREVFEITAKGIERLLKPRRYYIFKKIKASSDKTPGKIKEQWIAVIVRDDGRAKERPQCRKSDGILGVASDLKMTIDQDNFKTLSGEDQKRILKDPLRQQLEIQVCAPIVYEDEVYGIIALGDIPKYSKQENKILVNMISNLTASSMVNSMLFSEYKHKATRDPLTNLTNKGAFLQAIERAVVKANREKVLFSVFIFDIDYFKKYNDSNGHQAGDEALKITAKLIKESFRSGDVKARYGGEEFIILMNGATKEQAYASAERFREKVEKHPYPHEEKQPNGILTISGGVATCPDDGESSKEVIERADEALYRAKEFGRNRVGKAQSIDFSDGLDLGQEGALK